MFLLIEDQRVETLEERDNTSISDIRDIKLAHGHVSKQGDDLFSFVNKRFTYEKCFDLFG